MISLNYYYLIIEAQEKLFVAGKKFNFPTLLSWKEIKNFHEIYLEKIQNVQLKQNLQSLKNLKNINLR